jgi:hypothetical protein
VAKLRPAPEGRVGEAELGARRQLVLCLVETLKLPVSQIKALDRQIATALREHPDGEIFRSLFKDPTSVICAAELLAEIGDLPLALPNPRLARRRRRPGRGRDRVRQTQGSLFSLGLQQAPALSVLHTGRQHPPLASLGR